MASDDSDLDLEGVTLDLSALLPKLKTWLVSELRSDPVFAQTLMQVLRPTLQDEMLKFARSNNSTGTLTSRPKGR